MPRKKLNIVSLKQIPILHVAEVLGIALRKTGSGIYNQRSDEDEKGMTSLTIFEEKNRWFRYSGKTIGGVCSGSTIDLVMHMHESDFKTACAFLQKMFPEHS